MDLDFTDRLVDVIEEGFDAVIRTGEVRDTRLMSRKLGTFRHRIVAAPHYLEAAGTPLVPEDLLQHRWRGAAPRPADDACGQHVGAARPPRRMRLRHCLPATLRGCRRDRGRPAANAARRPPCADRHVQGAVADEPLPVAEGARLRGFHGRQPVSRPGLKPEMRAGHGFIFCG